MKTYNRIRTLTAALATAISIGAPATQAASYVVGLSPHYSTSDAQAVLKHLLVFVLEDASTGDDILVYDALNQQAVTRFTIPEGKLFQKNARARVQRLASPIADLRRFLSSESSARPGLVGVVHLPEFLDLAGPQLRTPGQPLRVIIVASPFYINPEIPSFNMDDAYPSDAHLNTSQSVSVFGTALRRQRLSGVTVHYAWVGQGSFINDYHQERITRFWSLFVGQQQGELATFAPDLSLALRRARDGVRQPVVNAQLSPQETKIQMMPVNRRPVPQWLAPTNQIVMPPETEPQQAGPGSTELRALRRAELPVQTTQGRIGIGIMWSAPVDCDLWVKAHPAAKDLFFQNRTTQEGRYFHDYRSANEGVDYEYVELNGAEFGSVRAWVNFFDGTNGPVSGVVVVRLNGQTYRGEYHLAAAQGNRAVDRNRRGPSPHWTELDLLRIVGLHSTTASADRP